MLFAAKGMLFTSCGDDLHDVFIDGKQVNSNADVVNANKGLWSVPISTLVPLNAQLIAVAVTNLNGAAGWKGSFYDGSVVTDGSWKCSANFYSGWQKLDFDDSQWLAPYQSGSTTGCPGFPPSAKWLWSERNYNTLTTTYCRKSLGKSNECSYILRF